MIPLDPPFRLATEADAAQLAELVNFAGEGLPLYLWQGMAKDGQDPWEIGRARQATRARDGQIVVMDHGGIAVAGLTGYVIGATPEPVGDDFPALFRPMQELENQAPESWYINVLACYPEWRGQGIGSQLLDIADRIGRSEGLERMSVIVADDNTGARRLYERHGYAETARLPVVRENWATGTENWVLLMKTI